MQWLRSKCSACVANAVPVQQNNACAAEYSACAAECSACAAEYSARGANTVTVQQNAMPV